MAALSAVLPAAAHHPMGGQLPATALQGLLSGLGHPVIGWDHLVFLLAAAAVLAASRLPHRQAAAMGAAFIAASSAATLAGAQAAAAAVAGAAGAGAVVSVLVAVAVAASLFAVAALLWRPPPRIRPWPAAALAALCGLAHGQAYAEAVVGAESTPLVAYLAGLAAIQFAVFLAGFKLLRAAGAAAGRGVGHGVPAAVAPAGMAGGLRPVLACCSPRPLACAALAAGAWALAAPWWG